MIGPEIKIFFIFKDPFSIVLLGPTPTHTQRPNIWAPTRPKFRVLLILEFFMNSEFFWYVAESDEFEHLRLLSHPHPKAKEETSSGTI